MPVAFKFAGDYFLIFCRREVQPYPETEPLQRQPRQTLPCCPLSKEGVNTFYDRFESVRLSFPVPLDHQAACVEVPPSVYSSVAAYTLLLMNNTCKLLSSRGLLGDGMHRASSPTPAEDLRSQSAGSRGLPGVQAAKLMPCHITAYPTSCRQIE